MTEIKTNIGFYFICNKSRVNEARRELPKLGSIKLYLESRAVRERDGRGNLGPVLGKMVGGVCEDDQAFTKIQEEVTRRRLGISEVEMVDIENQFGTKRGYRRWLGTIELERELR